LDQIIADEAAFDFPSATKKALLMLRQLRYRRRKDW
jgi:hypothetical protein